MKHTWRIGGPGALGDYLTEVNLSVDSDDDVSLQVADLDLVAGQAFYGDGAAAYPSPAELREMAKAMLEIADEVEARKAKVAG